MVKIAGITRIRNEGHIIQETLDYFADFCKAGLYIYDDCSTDNTVEICKKHSAVIEVIEGQNWNSSEHGRKKAEGSLRDKIFRRALQDNPDWFFYFDADERPEFDWEGFDFGSCDSIRLRLFDYYITPEDVDKHWSERKWLGPEFRNILMMFRNVPGITFTCREPKIPDYFKVKYSGYVKHYGKAISVEKWDEACHYYINHRFTSGRLNQRWKERIGKAIHSEGLSDFGLPLIQWHEKESKGILLKTVLGKMRKEGSQI